MKNIKARTGNLIKKYGTRDPEELARELKIHIVKKPFKQTMGFFRKELRHKFIVINSNLSELDKRIVIAHELGHALFHASASISYVHEYTLFPRGKIEIEANKFAAELLINENEIDPCLIKEMTIKQLACFYGVPEKLIEYKFNVYI